MERAQRSTIAWFAVAVAIIALVINAVGVRGSGSSTVAAAATTPTVQVTLKEFSITPSSLTAAPGPLKITVTNAGTTVHNFSITGLKATRDLNPGESQTLDVDVKAGHYEIQCTIPGHSGSGMKAMLMVAEGAPASSADSAASTDSTMSWQDMDKAMADVAKSFPAATKGHGGEPLPPTVLADGTKEFDLTAQVVDWEVAPGKTVKAWTYNGVVPAPEIHVAVGDKVKVVLKNELPESTALHFHGVRVPNSMDGVDPYTQPPIEPGQTFTYEFTTLEPAVGMYHSHHDAQVQVPNGMAGAFLVGDMPIPTGFGAVNVTQHVNMVLNDAGTIGLSLNGKSFPATEAYKMKVGETMEVNYFNEGLMSHPMHLHQPRGLVIAKDGSPLTAPYYADTINVAPGERYTVLYTAQDKGVWAWHCHILNHAETPDGMTGMVTAIIVE